MDYFNILLPAQLLADAGAPACPGASQHGSNRAGPSGAAASSLPLEKGLMRESRLRFAQPGGTLPLLQFKGYSSNAKCCLERMPGLLVQNVFLHRVIALLEEEAFLLFGLMGSQCSREQSKQPAQCFFSIEDPGLSLCLGTSSVAHGHTLSPLLLCK